MCLFVGVFVSLPVALLFSSGRGAVSLLAGAYLVAMRQQTGCSVDPGQFPLFLSQQREAERRLIVQCLSND